MGGCFAGMVVLFISLFAYICMQRGIFFETDRQNDINFFIDYWVHGRAMDLSVLERSGSDAAGEYLV